MKNEKSNPIQSTKSIFFFFFFFFFLGMPFTYIYRILYIPSSTSATWQLAQLSTLFFVLFFLPALERHTLSMFVYSIKSGDSNHFFFFFFFFSLRSFVKPTFDKNLSIEQFGLFSCLCVTPKSSGQALFFFLHSFATPKNPFNKKILVSFFFSFFFFPFSL